MNSPVWQGAESASGRQNWSSRQMAEDAREQVGGGTRLRDRLVGRLLFVAGMEAVLLALVALGLIDLGAWALAGIAVLALAATVPDTGEQAAPVGSTPAAADVAFADAVRLFADAIPDPCIVLDRRSTMVHLNPPARHYFAGAALGNPLAYTLRFPALLGAIETVRRTGAPATIELHQSVPTETWYKAAIAPLAPGDPVNDGVLVITLQSLTESRRLEQLRSDFIANASHELRTPLTSLAGFIDTLLGPAANDAAARERFLTLMRGQAQRMSKLIEDLLSLSRIEMRQHVRPTGQVELTGLIREVVEGLTHQAEGAGVRLEVTLPEEKVTIGGDRDELYEVFENLIDNAIKYGADGGRIEIGLGPADRQGFDLLATVTDHGAGVASEHVPRLTERFYRVDAESSRRKKGTGLGLAIVKHIVNRHHGLLTIRSRPGEGTRVEVLLRK